MQIEQRNLNRQLLTSQSPCWQHIYVFLICLASRFTTENRGAPTAFEREVGEGGHHKKRYMYTKFIRNWAGFVATLLGTD